MKTKEVTRAEVDRYLLMFEKTRRRHGLAIAVETIIAADRHGKKTPAAHEPASKMLEEAARQIVAEVARVYGVTLEQLRFGKPGTAARREACWRLRELKWSYHDVSRFTGVTENNACAAVCLFRQQLVTDPMLRRRVGVEKNAGASKRKAA